MQLNCLNSPHPYRVDTFLEHGGAEAQNKEEKIILEGVGEIVRISERNAQKDNHPGQVPRSQSMEAACDSQQ